MPNEYFNEEKKPEQKERVYMPQNDLQYNMMTTESAWGSPEMNDEVKQVLSESTVEVDANGNIIRDEEGRVVELQRKELWNRFSIYTRDLRLANLDAEEQFYVNYHLDLAFAFLQKDLIHSASICLGFCATVLETSQSKKGFLRRRLNTLTTENITRELEPAKRSLFKRGKED